MIYTHLVIYCLFDFPLQAPLALMLLFSHSCLTFTFPCWLSHRIDNRGLSGCQDNRIGLHRDHVNGNVDWTWVALCLAVANTNNAGTHEYVKDHHFESPRLPQSWGRTINPREMFNIIAANLASVCYTEADTKVCLYSFFVMKQIHDKKTGEVNLPHSTFMTTELSTHTIPLGTFLKFHLQLSGNFLKRIK